MMIYLTAGVAAFLFVYLVVALQPWMPLNPYGKGMVFPSAIFEAMTSFMTNRDLQHYSGEQVLSNFSQIFFCIAMLFLSAAAGLCALTAIIRALRGDSLVGNYFMDIWRVLVYMFCPIAFVVRRPLVMAYASGSPVAWSYREI